MLVPPQLLFRELQRNKSLFGSNSLVPITSRGREGLLLIIAFHITRGGARWHQQKQSRYTAGLLICRRSIIACRCLRFFRGMRSGGKCSLHSLLHGHNAV